MPVLPQGDCLTFCELHRPSVILCGDLALEAWISHDDSNGFQNRFDRPNHTSDNESGKGLANSQRHLFGEGDISSTSVVQVPFAVMDRAGFEPATFRFFFAPMRTGRSLALFSYSEVYQAELPALGSVGKLHAFKRLSQKGPRFTHQNYSIASAIRISMRGGVCFRSTEKSAAQDQTWRAVHAHIMRNCSAYCALCALVPVDLAAFDASPNSCQFFSPPINFWQ